MIYLYMTVDELYMCLFFTSVLLLRRRRRRCEIESGGDSDGNDGQGSSKSSSSLVELECRVNAVVRRTEILAKSQLELGIGLQECLEVVGAMR